MQNQGPENQQDQGHTQQPNPQIKQTNESSPYQTREGRLGPPPARWGGKPLKPIQAKQKRKPVQKKGNDPKKEKKPMQAKVGTSTVASNGSGSGGGLPTQLKENMESMSGMDLSDVKVNYNSSKPKEMGALAYAQGSQIEIGPGQEKHLPHEAWHTVQQKQGRVQPNAQVQAKGLPLNNDAGLEKEADVMGEKAMQNQVSPSSQRLTIGQKNSQVHQLQPSPSDQYLAGNYQQSNFVPATGLGLFDVHLNPKSGRLEIKVKVSYNFKNGVAANFANAADAVWTRAEKNKWKNSFDTLIEGRWGGKYHFTNSNIPWATVYVDVEVEESARDWHYRLDVNKIPKGDTDGSSVTHFTRGGAAIANTGRHYATLDSEDMEWWDKRSAADKRNGVTNSQKGAVHEFGHMIGLGDEYADGRAGVDHSALVQSALGNVVAEGRTNDIMSIGNSIEKQHYVTFLDALQKVTNDNNWKFAP